ncbi:hypothetical protein GCM10010286_24440 [Streptomyces toxytricini]|nr:hypothetical protein GCM10010286_24440 [Streptomyces toxytricini]
MSNGPLALAAVTAGLAARGGGCCGGGGHGGTSFFGGSMQRGRGRRRRGPRDVARAEQVRQISAPVPVVPVYGAVSGLQGTGGVRRDRDDAVRCALCGVGWFRQLAGQMALDMRPRSTCRRLTKAVPAPFMAEACHAAIGGVHYCP